MPSSLNLQATLNWCLPHLGYMPLTVGGMEPALSNANIILQTILGPPFCWNWNRGVVAINCVANQQDYQVALADFGFIEKVTTKNATADDIKEFEVWNALSLTLEKGRPAKIAAQLDDNAGNITFRTMPVTDENSVLNIIYQKKPVLMTSLASYWSPIPDEMSYIFNFGFLAMASMLSDDPRFSLFNQKFTSHLLGKQQGLDEMQRNIFLGNWLQITSAVMSAQQKTQQGNAARQL